jgi:small subunit ribosomal protein S17e
MGRIKSAMVKKATTELLKSDGHEFTEDFEHNKRLLGNNMPSKKVRNKIAGYLARLIKTEKSETTI